ncbi:hypothetical protein ACJX0J_005860, partial [Zea mays]
DGIIIDVGYLERNVTELTDNQCRETMTDWLMKMDIDCRGRKSVQFISLLYSDYHLFLIELPYENPESHTLCQHILFHLTEDTEQARTA